MNLPIATVFYPWRNTDEYLQVGHWLLEANCPVAEGKLFEEQYQNVQKALKKVLVWRIRAGDIEGLPHCLETTASLAEILIKESELMSNPAYTESQRRTSISSYERRLIYATAISRGVNGVADAMQPQRGRLVIKKFTIKDLCKRAGLPKWIVMFRHDVSHGALPSLANLQISARTLLDYLQSAYWKPLSEEHWRLKSLAHDILIKFKALAKMDFKNQLIQEKIGPFCVSEGEDNKSMSPNKRQKTEIKQRKTSQNYAEELIAQVPLEVGEDITLAFLVRGIDSTRLVKTSSLNSRGALIPGNVVEFPENQKGVSSIRKIYAPLLITVQRSWTGFARVLVIEIVDYMLALSSSNEQNENGVTPTGGTSRKLYFLLSWVEFMLSFEWNANFYPELRYALDTPKEKLPAPSVILLTKEYFPLNSLYDRCVTTMPQNHEETTGYLFLAKLRDILAECLDPRHEINDVDPPSPLLHKSEELEEAPCEISEKIHNKNLDLADIEKWLENEGSELDDFKHGSKEVLKAKFERTIESISKTGIQLDACQQQVDTNDKGQLTSLNEIERWLSLDNRTIAPCEASEYSATLNKNQLDVLNNQPSGRYDRKMGNSAMSLEEMEKWVEHSVSTDLPMQQFGHNTNCNSVDECNILASTQKSRWERCQTWDLCPLGTLPGVPPW